MGAASDPDPRVSGKGYAILRAAGIEVVEKVLADEAAEQMAGYLIRSLSKRPEVILKLALSSDGKIGRQGAGQVAITGDIARREVYLMRAEADGILVGIGTALEDDPALTVRLPGLENRSPARIVLDRQIRLPEASKLASGVDRVPLYVAACLEADPQRRAALERAGVRFIGTETHEGGVALPELLEDLAALGMASVLVEGGARWPALSWPMGWSTASCCSRGRKRSAMTALHRPSTPTISRQAFASCARCALVRTVTPSG